MQDTGHFEIAEENGADANLVANVLILWFLLCLAGLTTACGAASQSGAASTPNTQTTPAAQLRISIPPAQATVGVPYNAVSSVSGGTGPYTFSIASGSLPPGFGPQCQNRGFNHRHTHAWGHLQFLSPS